MNLFERAWSAIAGDGDPVITRVPLERPPAPAAGSDGTAAWRSQVDDAFEGAARLYGLDSAMLRAVADRWPKAGPSSPEPAIYAAAAELRARMDRSGGQAPTTPQQEVEPDQQVVTSARAWRGAGGGRGAVSGMRLDTEKGRRERAVAQEADRLAAINPASRDRLRALAEFNLSQPAGVEPRPVDRKAQYAQRGLGDREASANAEFDARLEQRLNARTQAAPADAVTGERIVHRYNPHTERERVAAEDKEMQALRADARQRAAAQEMPAVARGLAKGAGELYALGRGAAGLAGQLTGNDGLRDWGLEGYRDAMRSVNNIGTAPGFTGIRSAGDAAQWAMENSGYLALQAAAAVLSSGMGGLVAGTVGKRALGEVIGSTLSGAGQTFGSVYVEAVEQAHRTGQPLDLQRAMTGAATSMVIDALAGRMGLGTKAADAFKGRAYAQAARSMAVQGVEQGATQVAQQVVEDWGAGRSLPGPGETAGLVDGTAVGTLSGVWAGANGVRRSGRMGRQAPAAVVHGDQRGIVPERGLPADEVARVEAQPTRPEVPHSPQGQQVPAQPQARHAEPDGVHAAVPQAAVRDQHMPDGLQGVPARAQVPPPTQPHARGHADAPAADPGRADGAGSSVPTTPATAGRGDQAAATHGMDAQDGAAFAPAAVRVHALDSGTLLVQGDSSHVREELLRAGLPDTDIRRAGANELLVAPRSAAWAQEALAPPARGEQGAGDAPGPHATVLRATASPASAATAGAPAPPVRLRMLDKGTLSVEGSGPSVQARLRDAGIPEGDLMPMPGDQLHVARGSAARARQVLAEEAATRAPAQPGGSRQPGPAGAQGPDGGPGDSPQPRLDGAPAGVAQGVVSTMPSRASVDASVEERREQWPKTGPDGQPWKPNAYTVAFEMQLQQEDFGKHRKVHYRRANDVLKDAFAKDPDFAQMMERMIPGIGKTVQSTRRPKAPPGWVWEHASTSTADGRKGVMRLVPKEQHTPGSPFWRLLHPDTGARGGYSEWAIPAGAPPNRRKKPQGDGPAQEESGPAPKP